MNSRDISINDKIEIVYNGDVYKSNVQDITDKYISISIPIKQGKYAILSLRDVVEVVYINDRGAFQFTSVVLGRRVENIRTILITPPKTIKEIQRREFVRVLIIKYFNYTCFRPDGQDISINKEIINKIVENNLLSAKGMVLDLSGGGMKIKVNDKVNLGDVIIASFDIEKDEIILKGKIVRVEKDDEGKNICGVKFADLDKRDRDKIIQYLFKIMRKQIVNT